MLKTSERESPLGSRRKFSLALRGQAIASLPLIDGQHRFRALQSKGSKVESVAEGEAISKIIPLPKFRPAHTDDMKAAVQILGTTAPSWDLIQGSGEMPESPWTNFAVDTEAIWGGSAEIFDESGLNPVHYGIVRAMPVPPENLLPSRRQHGSIIGFSTDLGSRPSHHVGQNLPLAIMSAPSSDEQTSSRDLSPSAERPRYYRWEVVNSALMEQQFDAGTQSLDIVPVWNVSLSDEEPVGVPPDIKRLLSSIADVLPVSKKESAVFLPSWSRYLAPQTPVAERIDELILEEQGDEALLLDRKKQAEWLKQVMASHWGIRLPQPFIGFELDDGLFIASWQSANECNTLTIDAKERKGWYDPWPANEGDNPMPWEIDLETEEAWELLRSALTATRS